MKKRNGFVSNSSSTSFIITNLTEDVKTLVDLVKETPYIIKEFVDYYECNKEKYTQDLMIESARDNNIVFPPNKEIICTFGDEDGTLIGEVYDYMLRGFRKRESDILYEKMLEAEKRNDQELANRYATEMLITIEKEQDSDPPGIDTPSFKVRFYCWNR